MPLGTFTILILYFSLFISQYSLSQWVQVSKGLDGGGISNIAVYGSNIYAATSGGLFVTTNNGTNWNLLYSGITNFNVLSVAVSGNKIFIGTDGSGVFRSTDNGLNWIKVNNGLTDLKIYSIAVSGNTVFAGTDNGLFLSTDNGNSWNLSHMGGNLIYSVLAYDNYVFATTNIYPPGTSRSTDGGLHWSQCIISVKYFSKVGNNIYATGGNSIYVSSNNGDSWLSISNDFPGVGTNTGVIVNGNNLYVGTYGSGVYRSTNNGQNWTSLNNGLTNLNIFGLVYCNHIIYAGTNYEGIYSITDTGNTWYPNNNGIHNRTVSCIYENGNNLILAVPDKGVCISTNGGTEWFEKSNGITNKTIVSVTSINNYLIAGAVYPSYGWSIFYSSNFGNSWINSASSSPVCFQFIVDRGNVYSAMYGVSYSSNNGLNWIFINGNNPAGLLNTISKKGNTLFCGGYWGISRTTNNGVTWDSINIGLPSYKVINYLYSDSINIYAGLRQHGFYISTNNGDSWIQRNNGLTHLNINCIYKIGNSLFAGTDTGGVYVTSNNGFNWTKINEGLLSSTILSLFAKNGYLYAGTRFMGLWRRPIGEITDITKIKSETPSSFSLSQNFPNPFNPSTSIKYSILGNQNVKLLVYDLLGREVETLVNEKQSPGTYEVKFEGSKFSSGIYFYKLTAGDFNETKKMLLIK